MPHQIINVINKLVLRNFYVISIMLITCLMSSCGGGGGSSSSVGALSVSGEITVQRDSDVDLDLNVNSGLNNDIDDPQFIANPSTIGGYLSGYSGAYSSSEIAFNEDLVDYFNVQLVEGQKINLSVFQADSDLNSIDLELSLLDESQQAQASLTIDQFNSNSLVVPSDGLYTVSLSVSPTTSPMLYTLALSQTISNQSLSATDHSTLDFIPGEVLIKFKNRIKPAAEGHVKNTKNNSLQVNTDIYHSVLENVSFKASIPGIADLYEVRLNNVNPAMKIDHYEDSESKSQLDLISNKIKTLNYIETLKSNEQIEFAEPNFIYRASATTDDPRFLDQWNLSMLSAPAAWEASTGQGVVVAVLDTGINLNHEDLTANLHAEGYDFITDTNSSGDGNGFDTDPSDKGTSFHGSHVAGIIAAEANNTLGIAGLAYDSKIMALRVLGIQDAGSSSDIAQAILYASGLANSSGATPTQRADIINMSFGGEALSETIKSAIDQAYSQGLILIAAAGNSATDKPFYPAAFENVVGVGAISNDKQRSSFSNFGDNVQVVAPGGTGSGSSSFDGFQDAILSTVNDNNYTDYLGTSMSAPHVSAVAALMKEIKPTLTGQSFNEALSEGVITTQINTVSDTNNFFGYGLIDPPKAINWAAGSQVIPAILSTYPTKFGFIGANTEAELSLTNPGAGSVTITSISEQEPWLEITPKSIDATSLLGTYLVEVNPSLAALDQGIITISYRVDGGAIQQEELTAFISRSSQTDSTVGNVFVSLYKEENILNNNYERAYGLNADLNNGVYTYRFNQVEKGRYLLTASTDHDGDKLSFDLGEAVGSYPIQSRPSIIEINDNSLTNLNFNIQYPSFTSSEQSLNIQINSTNK